MALLVPSGIALLLGLDAGLLLLGLPAPLSTRRLPEVHGMVMTIGFVGSLIALERAVAQGRKLAYTAPLGMSLGALLALSPAPLWVGQAVMLVGAFAMVLGYLPLWRRSYDPAVAIQFSGAFLAVGATGLWLGGVAIPQLVPWLTGFLVLTIAGERVELARIGQLTADPTRQERHDGQALALAMALVVVIAAASLWPDVGLPVFGGLLVLVSAVFAFRDIARRTVRSTGLPRFSAACLLAGYAWLAVAGVLWFRPALSGLRYDAVLHATFLGFVMSMILAHAPVILPAVLRRPLPYTPAFWGVAVLLHGSLLVRVVGDLAGSEPVRAVAGTLNVLALLALVATAVASSANATRVAGLAPAVPVGRPRRTPTPPTPVAEPNPTPAADPATPDQHQKA
ncbi:hypothetical protein GA0111570_106112 [Raineyella antarctica]|uniref:Uncharacterized protein n=2 Tax=Raineyella antarctica TaxID=1577474 RepID=A0A1G6H2Z9_9ACTN|nr:hypothetical protein GA0111570_106112 [Raineyella antarctica]